MRTIYIDENFRCHATQEPGTRPVQTVCFDGRCDAYIEGCRFVPAGECWARDDGVVFWGEMAAPIDDYAALDSAQRQAERAALRLLGAAGELAPVAQAQTVRQAVGDALALADDATAVRLGLFIEPWQTDGQYTVGRCAAFGGHYYRCLTAHTAQPGWAPPDASSLWVRIDDPAEEWPQWRQPFSAQSAYSAGAKVTHDAKRWLSELDGNVWQPGVYGWREVDGA